MDRRRFLTSVGALGGAAALVGATPLLLPDRPRARGLQCTPYNAYGVQQCEAGIDSSRLDVTTAEAQNASQWCWAACIQGVFTYYGHPVSQRRIVQDTWGSVVNMPAQPHQIMGAVNRAWVDDRGRRFTAVGDTVSTNHVTAAQDLAEDHPLIIGTQGHAMLLTSLTYVRDAYGRGEVQFAEVRDPWPTNQRHRMLSAQEWYGIVFAARLRVY